MLNYSMFLPFRLLFIIAKMVTTIIKLAKRVTAIIKLVKIVIAIIKVAKRVTAIIKVLNKFRVWVMKIIEVKIIMKNSFGLIIIRIAVKVFMSAISLEYCLLQGIIMKE